ncbi:MAG: hypothetical protein RI911_286 [Candidatus Parcubacteria bacterium]|jgi:hypothetical protein
MAGMWWFILLFSFLSYFGYGLVLMYHWFSYSLDSKAALTASLVYNGAGCLLVLTMASAILAM